MAIRELELRRFTPEEYLTIEREALEKSEYVCGYIYAMSGSTSEHDTITVNITVSLGSQLKGRPCRVFSSNMRMRALPEGLFTYPDVTVVCGDLKFHDQRRDTITNAKLIVEVLSKSTEKYDRGRKFELYKEIDSFTDYLLVAQDRPRIGHFTRQPDGQWNLTVAQRLDARLEIESIGCALELSDVYDGIAFAADGERHS